MLTISGLNQYYGGSHILRDLSFEVPKGACTTILGRNGVGKTTLLKCLVGVVPTRSGALTFDGKNITSMPPYERARLGIGYVPQGREIFPRLTVEENLLMGLAPKAGGSKIPARIFEMFPVLKDMLHRRGGDLSGGQQQQLAIGRALAGDPKILILDEPTEGIQPNIVEEIEAVIGSLKGTMTVLLVEQFLGFALANADHCYVMEHGSIVLSGKPTELPEARLHEALAI